MLKGYELAKELSSDADKSIYLVKDSEGRRFVLKIFHRVYKYSIYERLSRLMHSNMPTIHRVSLTEKCFYVLEEYIEGRTLQEILELDGVFNKVQAIDIIMQLCDVLKYLHNQLPPVIHRDIKPANVMLTSDGAVKLLDFDIAREHKDNIVHDTEIVGTRHFAPPEQYGFSQSDHKTDIYSLGVLLTVLLTNTYDASRIKSSSVRRIVRHCTAFDPKRRYRDVRQLWNRLRLCTSPIRLLGAFTGADTGIYVFPNVKLKVMRLIIPVAALYILTIALSFIQPYPVTREDPQTNLFLMTIIVNPQWIASESQYKAFFVIVYTVLFTFLSFGVFAVYDFIRFYYLRAVQRYCLKTRIKEASTVPPFIIASKRYVYCMGASVVAALIIISIPFVGVWAYYDIHDSAMLLMILCCVVSLVFRGSRYPRHYNKAVSHYYRGNIAKAVLYAKKSTKTKRNHAKVWLEDIIRLDASGDES